jgi:hypothetical protein
MGAGCSSGLCCYLLSLMRYDDVELEGLREAARVVHRCGAVAQPVVCASTDKDLAVNFSGLGLPSPRSNCQILPSSWPTRREILHSFCPCPGSGMPISASTCPNPAALAGRWTCRRCTLLARPFSSPVRHFLPFTSNRGSQTQTRSFSGVTKVAVSDTGKAPISHRLKVGQWQLACARLICKDCTKKSRQLCARGRESTGKAEAHAAKDAAVRGDGNEG